MKKAIYFLLIIVSGVLGCKKDGALKSLRQQLTGTWELTKTFGGWTGEQVYSQGNGNTIEFKSNSYTTHFVSADTSYITGGIYTLYEDRMPCGNGEEITQIVFDSAMHDDFSDEIMISGGELSIGNTQCIADGSTSFYRRIN